MSNTFTLNKQIAYTEGGVTSKVVIKSEKLNITLFCMAKGTDISEHTSTKEGTVFVLEGNGIFRLAGKEIIMQKDVLIHMVANQPHSISAIENTSFLLTLAK